MTIGPEREQLSGKPIGSIEVSSGVSMFDGSGFCTVSVDGKSIGQMTPDTVREMGMHFLSVAEAAEQDAAVVAELKEIGLPTEVVGGFLIALRSRRAQ